MAGRLVCHRDGYGFVIPEEPLPQVQGDIFIGMHGLGNAMHGDRVLVSDLRVGRGHRAEGRILRVLKRAQETVVGQFHFGVPSNYVVALEERILQQILIPKGQELPSGTTGAKGLSGAEREQLEEAWVNVEITRFPTATQEASGRVLEILGRPGDFAVDVEIILRKHHLPHQFPPDVCQEAEMIPQGIPPAEIRKRRDFHRLPIVTIDGETARDFDDAVAVVPLPQGHFQLQVHIADVAYYVRPGTALDREARLRGTSVYFPDRAIPMLPVALSNGICSLNPGEDRLVLSVLLEIDRRGEILESAFCQGVIRSAERMTYTAVNAVLENDPQARQRYARMAAHFEQMEELALILNRKRQGRGAIDFDLPEAVIQFDEFGTMTAITRSERNRAHRLIEEFMLAANEAVAAFLERMGVETLYRIHEKPEPQKVIEFEQIASTFGYSLGVGPLPVKRFPIRRRGSHRDRDRQRTQIVELPASELEISPRNYQRLAGKIAGKPEERILSYLMLRSLKQACYRERNEGHFALATACYTHFTSPIRRYPDLVVHRILRSLLDSGAAGTAAAPGQGAARAQRRLLPGQEPPTPRAGHIAPVSGPIAKVDLEEIALQSSEAERRAEEAERELMEWKKARFMRDKLGDEFDALIISVTKFGFFVELLDLFVEGLVPLETLTDQRYIYREQQQQLVGVRTRRRFRLGDRLQVRLDRVGDPAGKMSFSVVD